ncbi:MAG: VPLPA-CTERM sorting domain-containing protein [Tateyamaria sp.]|uniref:VPLPA-CTERM sorting domain-containing protein n=1 Tax=Tateyamaria sp. TaxID=1929288 RepID=UPI0032943197
MRYISLAVGSVSLLFTTTPSFAATFATFETGATYSVSLISAVSKSDGSDVTDEITEAIPSYGQDEAGHFLEIEDGKTSGQVGSLSGSVGDASTGTTSTETPAVLIGGVVFGSDATADGKYVRGTAGFEIVSAWGYRAECNPTEFLDCSDDPGVDLTFSYNYEGHARIEVPDLIGTHQASAGVVPIISFVVDNFYAGGDRNTLLDYTQEVSVSNVGTNLVQEEIDLFSGNLLVSLDPGTAVTSYANVNWSGIVNLASTPTPVPLPASLPLLTVGLGGLGFIGRRRRKAKLAG